jgi:site-specific DNA-methyltransferase (adenine-specific)
MKTERVPIGSVQFDPANVRRHGEKNLDAIKASLSRFGQQKPIVVDADGIVRAGNGTLMAAKALGWPEVTIVRTSLKGAEATAYAIADNRTAELAEWDDDALAQTLAALQIEDEELAKVTGFDDADIDAMLAPAEVTEDEVPEPPVDPITKPGDLWLLGEHRLLCGDSTKAEDVERLMSCQKADMMFTDPPYGVSYVGKTKKALTIQNDGEGDLPKLLDGSFACSLIATRDGACWYVAAPPGKLHWEFARRLMELGVYRQTLVWVKDSMVLGHSDYHYKHEPIFYGWKPGALHRQPPNRTQVSVWEIDRPKRNEEHPTMKPVELVAKAIENSSLRGESIYDPFLGSGTTLIAAEQLGRKCYGMEISPAYCDVIVKRWETLTGRKATRG